jgi:pimeloyl-ACP methyl ester carboxylesterase
VGSEEVAVAGHSLGAALALLGGRALAEEGIRIEAHLFNAPFPAPAAPIERIVVGSRHARLVLEAVQQAAAAAVSGLLLSRAARRKALRSFLAAGSWFPHLYVNAADPICSSYIGFFSYHELLRKKIGTIDGGGKLGSFVSELSAPLSLLGALQSYAFGECQASHLLPCAHLFRNAAAKTTTTMRWTVVDAHALRQWWAPALELEHRRFDLSSSPDSSSSARTTDVTTRPR